MHIMVVPSWYASPNEKVHGSFFKEQFQALQRSGEKVTVAYNEIWPITDVRKLKEKTGIVFSEEYGLRTYRFRNYNFLPKNPNMFKFFNRRMERLYLEIIEKEGKVDIIHAHSAFWGGISASYVANKYNIPFVLTEHSSLKYSMYVKKSYEPWIKNAYDSANCLIAVGNGLKEEMEQYTKNKITVIGNMVDFSMFIPKEKKKSEDITLFSLAYLVPEKGIDRLIKAFAEAFKDDDNIKLRIGGYGNKEEEYKKLSSDLGMNEKITFLGEVKREDVVKEMNNCDGFVLPSEHETFGVVYIEALSLGKPVLGTKNGGAEDIIKDFNGILVENKNHEALVEGLKSFVKKIPEFSKEKIRENCINSYSEKVIIEKIKNVYKEVLKK